MKPVVDTVVYTRPMMPKGAQLMTQRMAVDRHSARSDRTFLVGSLAWLMARPKTTAHSRMPMKLALARAEMGLLTALLSREESTSPMPPGAAVPASASGSSRVEGTRKLATTAHRAARKVPTR